MLKMTSGSSANVISENDSCMSDKPWPVDPVAARAPVATAPHAMPTASSSDSALMHAPPASGSKRGEVFEHFGEGRHRVAREETTAGNDRGTSERLRSLHQRAFAAGGRGHASISVTTGVSKRKTSNTKSGHTYKQAAQPVHPGCSSG